MARKKLGGGRAAEVKPRVFCSECKWSVDAGRLFDHWCTHPSCYEDTYWQRGGKRVIDLEEKNRYNDCPDYEPVPDEPKAEPKGRMQRVREWLVG